MARECGFGKQFWENGEKGLTGAILCDIIIGKKRIWQGSSRIGTKLNIRIKPFGANERLPLLFVLIGFSF